MSTLWLFFFHIGFVAGAFLVSLIIGTLVIYLRPDKSLIRMYEVRDALPDLKKTTQQLALVRHVAGSNAQEAGLTIAEESEENAVIFPLRQSVRTPRSVFTSSHSV